MTSKRAILPEIQGLRAVAVALVLIFHIWPDLLPGGYVGVDVFFVISGYLITGLLARTALRDGTISLVDFYSRRARRLLPAATVVLAATLGGMLVFLPDARWEETATQIAASALYVQNWVLAWLAVDYLGAENAASPVQHYWSLSIEEQFYFIWPLLMIGTTAVARRLGFSLRRTFIAALGLIFASSLAASVVLTSQDQAQAYFVTHTRMWELALGGLLALSVHRFRAAMRVRAAMALAGLTAIGWSALFFTTATAFPGSAALLPTVGTVLIIMAGDVRLGVFRGLNAEWLRYVGDRSYSIYLWHWPLITFYTVRHEGVGLMDGVGLIALTLAISHLSYEYIEERYRHPQARAEWRPIGYGLTSILACVLGSGAIQYSVAVQANAIVLPDDPNYPGPAVLLTGASVPEEVELIPALAQLKRDRPRYSVELGCHQDQEHAEPITCTLGDLGSERTIVIFGDSHAGQWVPALDRVGKERGWKVLPFTKSACAFARHPVTLRKKPYTSCKEWRENVIAEILRIRPGLVITTQSRYGGKKEPVIEGMRSVWSELSASGISVIALEDTPWLPFQPGDCLGNGDSTKCAVPRAKAQAPGTIRTAASSLPGIAYLDMTDLICRPDFCETIVGNVIVWRDKHHITATYSRMLAPFLAERIGL